MKAIKPVTLEDLMDVAEQQKQKELQSKMFCMYEIVYDSVNRVLHNPEDLRDQLKEIPPELRHLLSQYAFMKNTVKAKEDEMTILANAATFAEFYNKCTGLKPIERVAGSAYKEVASKLDIGNPETLMNVKDKQLKELKRGFSKIMNYIEKELPNLVPNGGDKPLSSVIKGAYNELVEKVGKVKETDNGDYIKIKDEFRAGMRGSGYGTTTLEDLCILKDENAKNKKLKMSTFDLANAISGASNIAGSLNIDFEQNGLSPELWSFMNAYNSTINAMGDADGYASVIGNLAPFLEIYSETSKMIKLKSLDKFLGNYADKVRKQEYLSEDEVEKVKDGFDNLSKYIRRAIPHFNAAPGKRVYEAIRGECVRLADKLQGDISYEQFKKQFNNTMAAYNNHLVIGGTSIYSKQ